MNKEFKIDYLQFSSHRMPSWLINSIDDFKTRSNISFYRVMTKFANGAVMYEDNPNTDKRLFVLSGKVCERLEIGKLEKLKSLVDDHAKISRVDLCCTVDIPILKKIIESKDKIESKKFTDIKIIADSEYTPETIYIGDMKHRAKKGIVRAYDKALQLNLDMCLNRVEVELRKDDANIATKRVAYGEPISDVMNSKFRIDTEWYQEIFGDGISTKRFAIDDTVELTEIQRKMAWLEKQVAPTLQYVLDYDKANGTHNFERLINGLKF